MAFSLIVCLTAFGRFENMNGEYLTTPTPGAKGKYNTNWSEFDTANGGVEYFEVYMGPIESLYGEVWWKSVPTVALPEAIVKRFDGKGMAIVGYETDSVRKTPLGDVSVPINMAYNHHHDVYITGKHSKRSRVLYDPADPSIPLMARADPGYREVPVETSPSPSGLPTSLHLADGNGGEYRKSYHGFAPPVAYVIDSPVSAYNIPMFIDTWNRDKMAEDGGSKFVAGPLPRHSLAPPGSPYSGLLECPMTDKIIKVFRDGNGGFDPSHTPKLFDCHGNVTQCPHQTTTAAECFGAARAAVGDVTVLNTTEGASSEAPPGCSLTFDGAGRATAFFNTRTSLACCGRRVTTVAGRQRSLVGIEMSVSAESVEITLEGPAGVWFGVGFFAQAMQDKPYAIIVDGDGAVTERRLASHMGAEAMPAGTMLAPSVTVISSTVKAGRRTVTLRRRARGAAANYTSFTLQQLEIPFINAIGAGPHLGYHSNKTAATLTLWPLPEQPACICKQPPAPFGAAKGDILYKPTGEQFGFINACSPEPRESVLAGRNPTCDVRKYTGGLQVCKHGWSLLDTAQGQPWPDKPLVYYQKYRFYFQEYEPARHVVVLPRQTWAIGAFIGEYDVPQCAAGTAAADCKHEIWGVVTVGGDHLHIAAMHFHCHAPTCLAMEIINNRTGELICRQEPVYGGTGAKTVAGTRFDEPGYILQPPCLWGDGPGLTPMPLASGETFTVRAITNSTVGHHGEMAFPEIALVPWNASAGAPQAAKVVAGAVETKWTLLEFGGGVSPVHQETD